MKRTRPLMAAATAAFAVVLLQAPLSATAESAAHGSCDDGASEGNLTAWYTTTATTSKSSWHSVLLHNPNGLGNKNNLKLETKQDKVGIDPVLKSWTSGDNIPGNVEKNYWQIAGVTTPKGKQFARMEATFDNSGPDDYCVANTQKF